MATTSFRDLAVWQKAMELIPHIHRVTEGFPADETYLLADYLRRAAYSVPALIAAGTAHGKRKEFAQFLSVGAGAAAELECFIQISAQVGYLSDEEAAPLLDIAAETGQMLRDMHVRLRSPSM